MQLIFQPMQCLEPGLEFLNHKYYVTKWFQENVFNIQKNMDVLKGAIIFSKGGWSQFTKSRHQWNCDLLFRQQKILWSPPYRNTLPPKQAKSVLKSVFLNKINTLGLFCGHAVTLWPPHFSFQKFKTPQVYLGLPSSE